MIKSATLSECGKYRYELRRIWDQTTPLVMFLCLNPSTADEVQDDATIRKCISYAKKWRYGGLIVGNLFAYRATQPKHMKKAADPVGPENDEWLLRLQNEADLVVCAWGGDGGYLDRDNQVLSFIKDPHCLVKLKCGHPGHPLYKKKTLEAKPYRASRSNGR